MSSSNPTREIFLVSNQNLERIEEICSLDDSSPEDSGAQRLAISLYFFDPLIKDKPRFQCTPDLFTPYLTDPFAKGELKGASMERAILGLSPEKKHPPSKQGSANQIVTLFPRWLIQHVLDPFTKDFLQLNGSDYHQFLHQAIHQITSEIQKAWMGLSPRLTLLPLSTDFLCRWTDVVLAGQLKSEEASVPIHFGCPQNLHNQALITAFLRATILSSTGQKLLFLVEKQEHLHNCIAASRQLIEKGVDFRNCFFRL